MTPKGPLFLLQPFLKVVPTSSCILIPIGWVPSMFHVLWDLKNIPRPKPSPKHERREERSIEEGRLAATLESTWCFLGEPSHGVFLLLKG